MKVLFAVNNENISEAIVKKYQKEYKEIISYKNVYYFNAILKEIQKDKSYDKIVISEDLEQFTNSSYEQMDKFIFERLDSISDEASDMRGNDIPIIIICSERRVKSEPMLVKLFGIGLYNAIIGNDRSIEEVCRLIRQPRSKKEAKAYYRVESDEVNYQSESENDVSEIEIQNIVSHYKRLGKNEEKYVESFENIAAQYNDLQLRVIAKFLPLNVRAVLETSSPKYQKVMSYNNTISDNIKTTKVKPSKMDTQGPSERLLNPKGKNSTLSKPVVVPSSMNRTTIRKLAKDVPNSRKNETSLNDLESILNNDDGFEEIAPSVNSFEEPVILPQEPIKEVEETIVEPKKRRGRPKKNIEQPEQPVQVVEPTVKEEPKRRRGRPKKTEIDQEFKTIEEQPITSLPGLDDEFEEKQTPILPGFDDIEETPTLPGFDSEFGNKNYNSVKKELYTNTIKDGSILGNNIPKQNHAVKPQRPEIPEIPEIPGIQETSELPQIQDENIISNDYNPQSSGNLERYLTADKKIMAFVGTTKNGTSFIVNNLAEMLSTTMGINTAILDTTKNRNSYYIYTQNEDDLRKTAFTSISNLSEGVASGIKVNANLTVYTSLPNEDDGIENVETVLETLIKNHTVVLIDTDFDTPLGYFDKAQQLYLVQTMDILTIQPLTAFLRDLKAKNILNENKIRIVLNKYIKIRGISEKTIIGGMAFYNDPAMSYMTELFDRDLVKYTIIPFEDETYTQYLEALINCVISIKGYSKSFLQNLKTLADMAYPTVAGKGNYKPPTARGYGNGFSSDMNNTLNQMKRNY